MKSAAVRPKIKIAKTRSEQIWDVIGYFFYIGSIIWMAFHWNALPEQVPGHYNAIGEVDRWGSKWELLILPFVGLFILLTMQVLEKYPETHNYPQRLNESNAEAFYLLSRKLVNQLKNICLIVFALIIYESITIALNQDWHLGIWQLPVILGGTFLPIVITLFKQAKIK
ncbi:DUF1648 domain-containing protein [Bacillus mangrovi]|uniref:DUF1648 domain-containing protein n=1 Tax=Metabacillus mangrovi TaxID=1491830 RepID=A0A7X2S375_9BACI|nr:DUF1648 domain-containing protein [Metabacillus mangrovi]MTH52819.1 DUF1648 domain-containing protein [Metabacillus mangrovi]